jgi:hypothetical protein
MFVLLFFAFCARPLVAQPLVANATYGPESSRSPLRIMEELVPKRRRLAVSQSAPPMPPPPEVMTLRPFLPDSLQSYFPAGSIADHELEDSMHLNLRLQLMSAQLLGLAALNQVGKILGRPRAGGLLSALDIATQQQEITGLEARGLRILNGMANEAKHGGSLESTSSGSRARSALADMMTL